MHHKMKESKDKNLIWVKICPNLFKTNFSCENYLTLLKEILTTD